jgi:hypothetical protein
MSTNPKYLRFKGATYVLVEKTALHRTPPGQGYEYVSEEDRPPYEDPDDRASFYEYQAHQEAQELLGRAEQEGATVIPVGTQGDVQLLHFPGDTKLYEVHLTPDGASSMFVVHPPDIRHLHPSVQDQARALLFPQRRELYRRPR